MVAAGRPPGRGEAAEHLPEVQPAIAVDDPGIHQGVLIVSRDHICHLDSLEGGIHLLLVELVYVAESRLATAVPQEIHRRARHFSQHGPV